MKSTFSRQVIDFQIDHHLVWFKAFNAAVQAGGAANLLAPSLMAYPVGDWLSRPESMRLLGSDLHARALAIQSTLQDIAQEIVECIDAASDCSLPALLSALGELSESLVRFLDFAGKHLDGELTHWTLEATAVD